MNSTQKPNPPDSSRAVIYARISLDRNGEAVGVARQEADCRALAEQRGCTVVEVYVENDVSASTASTTPRPMYDAMLNGVREGKYGTILAYSNSRLTRRPMEFEGLIELHAATGVQIRTVVSGDDDLSTADGRMVARYKAVADAAEAERTRERVNRSNLHRVQVLGQPTNGIRYGWQRGRGGGLELNYEQAAIVQEIAARVIAGESLNKIRADLIRRAVPTPRVIEIARKAEAGKITDLSSRGIPAEIVSEIATRTVDGEPLTEIVADLNARRARIPRWTHGTLSSLVRRETNVARIKYQGQLWPGKFPPILDEETYDKVCTILGDEARAPRRPDGLRYREIRHFLSGVTVCGKPDPGGTYTLADGTRVCGARLRVRTGGGSTTYQSYSCTVCHGTGCRTEQVEGAAQERVIEWLSRPGAVDLLGSDSAEVAAQAARLSGLTERLRRLSRAYADMGMTDEEYDAERGDLDAQIADARDRMRRAGPVPELVRWAQGDPEAEWEAADPSERRDLIAALMTVVVLPCGRGRKAFDAATRLRFEWKA